MAGTVKSAGGAALRDREHARTRVRLPHARIARTMQTLAAYGQSALIVFEVTNDHGRNPYVCKRDAGARCSGRTSTACERDGARRDFGFGFELATEMAQNCTPPLAAAATRPLLRARPSPARGAQRRPARG